MSKLTRNEKAMLFAEGIVARYKARGNQLPHRSKTCRMDPNREQEYKDAAKLNDWKQSLKGNRGSCSPEIRDYLDLHLPSWRNSNKISRNDSSSSSDEENDSINGGDRSNKKTRMSPKKQPAESRKRRRVDFEEDEEEIARQILRDSQLLLQLNNWHEGSVAF